MNFNEFQGSHTERSKRSPPKRESYQYDNERKGHPSMIDSDSIQPNRVQNQNIQTLVGNSRAKASQQQIEIQKTSQNRSESARIFFEDTDFPRENDSLFGKNGNKETFGLFEGAKWTPLPHSFQLFLDKIEDADVIQTHLDDCYFVSVLSGLTNKKGRIEKLFKRKQSHLEGKYEVLCYYMGKEQGIILDSYFPFITKDGKVKTVTDTNGPESWVLLAQKAFAKTHGSYAAINGGGPTEAMRFLTGAPCEGFLLSHIHYDADQEDRLWNLLVNHGADYLFTCGIGPNEEARKFGLPDKHAYTILSAFTDDKSGDRVLKIRNPWGKYDKDGLGEWKGKWSDYDQKRWKEYLRRTSYRYQPLNDGVFHISFDDFLEYFTTIEICYLHENFDLQATKCASNSEETKYFMLTVKNKKTSFYIMVNQESKRKFSHLPDYSDFEYSEIEFNILNPKGKQLFPNDMSGQEQQVWKKVSLVPENYLIQVKVKWSNFALQKIKNNFVLNTYGPENVKLDNFAMSSKDLFLSIFGKKNN